MLYRLLRRDRVTRLVQEHRSGQRDHHKIIFSLVVLEEWLHTTGVTV